MFPRVDTKNATAVATLVREIFTAHYPAQTATLLPRLFPEVAAMFAGRHSDFHPIDLRYHDFEHTLQATTCMAFLLDGCRRASGAPRITARQFELAITGVMLHDVGYLKLRSDTQGTGAKYTFCHVLRSCAFAASYLPTLGVNEEEIGGVLGAINCSGPAKEISRLHFRDPLERFIGCALATADYLGQMAAADYPDELGILYDEFTESDDFIRVPAHQRMFSSAEDLLARTPVFWRKVVMPKLENDFQGVYRFLADPFPGGPNPYIQAVSRNISLIEMRAAQLSSQLG